MKSVQKWVCGVCRKNRPRGCGPFKKRRKQDNQTTRHWIEHALACLAARWRIYIYIYIGGLGGVSLACPSPRKPGNRFRFRSFVRAVRAGEAKLCGRVTDVASDAGAGSWELSSCLPALARAQMLFCAWVLSRLGLYVRTSALVYMPRAWV